MGRARISLAHGIAAVRASILVIATPDPGTRHRGPTDREATALAVRYLLQCLADTHPGNTLEVRVPPFGAVQCVEGPRHTRGTPPNVIETDAATWLELATGALTWAEAIATDRVSASGTRASLDEVLPLAWDTRE